MGDLAKVEQEPGEPIEKYVARFRTKRAKCAIVIVAGGTRLGHIIMESPFWF